MSVVFFRNNIEKIRNLKVNPKRKDLDELRRILNNYNFNVRSMSQKELLCLLQFRDMLYCYNRHTHALFELTLEELL